MRLLLLHAASNFMELLQVSCVCSCKKNGESDMGSESEEKKEMLIINGNAFYEIDLKCLEEKKKKQEAAKKHRQKGQRK